MRLERRLTNPGGHVHRFIVKFDQGGWNVREEEDAKVIDQMRLEDWHRVERALKRFEFTARTLAREGWVEA
jgi:hypothetical protein